ncbi:DUF6297 family protein [Streptosporangium soli]|nr:DUF6297 family protein [Streptosporangium sp. KLBMP 9127]
MTGGVGGVPAVRAFIRSKRRRPSSWSDRYAMLFGLVLVGATVAQPVSAAIAAAARQADPSRMGAGIVLLALAYLCLLGLARMFGPVALPAADAAWMVLSPLPRRGVLGKSAGILLAVSLTAGLVLGLAAFAVFGAGDQVVWRLAAALLLGVSATAGGMATAVLAQSSQPWDSWLTLTMAAAATVAALAALLEAGPGRQLLTAVAAAPASASAALAGLAAATAALLVRLAWRSLDRIPTRTLLAASTRVGHVATATVSMDPGALTWIAEDNHWRGRALRSRPWPALPAPLALAWQDWRRLARRPRRAAALLATAVLPAVAAQAGGGLAPPVTVLVTVAGGLAVAATAASGARRDGDNPSLARLLGVDRRAALAARAVLPALLVASWLTLALGGLLAAGALTGGPWWLFGPLAAPALAAGALRAARRRPIDHSMPVIDTPGGAIPTGPALWALTGVDLAALGTLPLVVALVFQPGALGGFLVAQAVTGAAVLAGYLIRAAR